MMKFFASKLFWSTYLHFFVGMMLVALPFAIVGGIAVLVTKAH